MELEDTESDEFIALIPENPHIVPEIAILITTTNELKIKSMIYARYGRRWYLNIVFIPKITMFR